ncbi:hypothetical protein SLS60_007449 [Paraconiothyrium brasiliense]|uniref:Thioredoxin domain-containing protein n=1 Tax=Paraconiothyrium brasiliense TaxID=300254 RepID=A0ABR3R5F0_9PLEO
MAPLNPGDKFPSDVVLDWVPIKNQDPTLAGTPQDYNASSEWKGKRVVLVSVPGAFTPSCQAYHLPPYIEQLDILKDHGVDQVAIIASNDGWVMSAWGKINRIEVRFSKKHGWDAEMANRNERWAMVIDKDGTVKYAEKEEDPTRITVSGVEAVLSGLTKSKEHLGRLSSN